MSRLGLPPGIRACLFDLDGVLTQTARLHAEAWKRRSTRFWPTVPGAPESVMSRSIRSPTTSSTSTGGLATTASGGFSLARGIDADDATVVALGDRKNELLLDLIGERGLEAFEGSVLLRAGGAGRGLAPGGRLRQRELPRRPPGGRSRPACSRCESTPPAQQRSSFGASRLRTPFLPQRAR